MFAEGQQSKSNAAPANAVWVKKSSQQHSHGASGGGQPILFKGGSFEADCIPDVDKADERNMRTLGNGGCSAGYNGRSELNENVSQLQTADPLLKKTPTFSKEEKNGFTKRDDDDRKKS